MSTANTLVTDSAVHLVTDGGHTDLATGKLLLIADKVQRLPAINSAFVALGGAWIGPYLMQDVSQRNYRSYRDLMHGVEQNLAETIRQVHEQVPGAPSRWGRFAIVFAGWDSDRGHAHTMLVDDKDGAPRCIVQSAPRFVALPAGQEQLDENDIERSAVRLLEAQRQRPVQIDGRQVYARAVNGFVQLTTISAAGLASKVLHHWPDIAERSSWEQTNTDGTSV